MSHTPKTVNKFKTGLVLYQPDQILSDDAFPVLLNAFVDRNRVKRRQAWNLIGRLQRNFSTVNYFLSSASPWIFNILSVSGYVETADNANPGQVTTRYPHDLTTGDKVIITGILGATGYNNVTFTITVVDSLNFTVGADATGFGDYGSGGYWISNRSIIATEPNAQLVPGNFVLTMGGVTFTDQGDGTITSITPGNSGLINYSSGSVTLTHTVGASVATLLTYSYYPLLPSMGIFDRNNINGGTENVYFDTKYAYRFVSGAFAEFLPGTIWNFFDYNLPSPANYWVDANNFPIFWITANTGTTGDPIRYTNSQTGSNWIDFSPTVDGTNNMYEAKWLIPFRSRLFAFNTWEGTSLAGAIQHGNLVRCSALGNPFTTTSDIISIVNANAWNDTIPGQGYQEDIPTTEEIISVAPTMNQIIIRTNTKSWVLTDTGNSNAPFRIDLLDETFGSLSPFGAVNMGGYLLGIANRAVATFSPTNVQSIDDKVLDIVFKINRDNNGMARVYGIRDYIARVDSFIYPYQPQDAAVVKFPNRRLIYNYQNQSYAIYEDSLTCMGYFRDQTSITWEDANFTWESADFSWSSNSTEEPLVCAGNNQGFIGFLDNGINDLPSLSITNILSNGTSAATFTSPEHNFTNSTVVQLSGITGDFASLNGTIGEIEILTADTFYIFSYNSVKDEFDIPVIIGSGTYNGGGLIQVRKNFSIMTKAFNLLDQGQSMHISYLDTLVNTKDNASVTMNIYPSLNTSNPVNEWPENIQPGTIFGNEISQQNPTTYNISEVNNRALVNQRANMLSIGFTLSNATMASDLYTTPFILSSFTLWQRPAGRPLMPFGGG